MSQQQNPQEVLQSLQQPTGLSGDNCQSDLKPFSIREYALASRQKDIFHSWPFPEKYLQIFLSRGINTVLPPFEPHDLAIQSLRRRPIRSDGSQKNKENVAGSDEKIHQSSTIDQDKFLKEECNLSKSDETVSEICSQDCNLSPSSGAYKQEDQNDCCIKVHSCNGALKSKRRLRPKQKWGKGKHRKKKSIANILDVAMPPASINVPRINILSRGLRKPPKHRVSEKRKKQVIYVEQNCESELTKD